MYVSADGKPRSRHVIIIVRGVVCMLNLHKTGYEKTGFVARVCAEGVNHDGDCSEIDPKQIDLSKEWLRKYAKPVGYINTEQSSYNLKHFVETDTQYIANGAFCKAAIEERYEYIIDKPNIYLNIAYDDGVHKWKEPTDAYGNPKDQEDYDHEIRTIADPEYASGNTDRWRDLLQQLLWNRRSYSWWDGWNKVFQHVDDVHPFFRTLMANIMSVITAIHLHANSPFSLDVEIYRQFTMKICGSCSFTASTPGQILEKYPDIYELYTNLPIHFRESNSTNGCCDGLTLPKAERLVKYMSSKEFEQIMTKLYNYTDVLTAKKEDGERG